MNIAVYIVDREGVDQATIGDQIVHALHSISHAGGIGNQAFIYVELDDTLPAPLRPRLTVLKEDAARGGFAKVVVSTLRDFSPAPQEQAAVVAMLSEVGVRVEIAGSARKKPFRH